MFLLKNHIYFSDLPGQFLSNTLLTKIRSKSPPEEIIEILKEPLMLKNGELIEPADISHSNLIKIDSFVQTILFIASKSFSHAFSAITKFIKVFKVRYNIININEIVIPIFL
jgi:nuclear cap-binding protein subunit 1